MTVVITVTNPHTGDTWIARGKGLGGLRASASSTNSGEVALTRCIEKMAAGRGYTVRRGDGPGVFQVEIDV